MAIQALQPASTPNVPPTSGADVLALLTGKPVDARVLNITVEGLTQLLLGMTRESIKLALPTNFPAGTLLTLQIKDGQLLVQPQGSGAPIPVPPNPAPTAPSASYQPPPAPDLASPRQAVPTPSPQSLQPTLANSNAPLLEPFSPANALQAQLQASLAPNRPVLAASLPQMPMTSAQVPAAASPIAAPVIPVSLQPMLSTPAEIAQTPLAPPAQSAPVKAEGLGALLANLATLEGRLAQFPAPVAAAARQFLGQQINLARSRLTGERLQQAIIGAGILGTPEEEGTPLPAPSPGTRAMPEELKSNLLMLRKALLGWVGPERAEALANAAKVLPPIRPGAPRSAHIDPTLVPDGETPEETAKSLLEQTDAALNRLRANHPAPQDVTPRPEAPPVPPRNEWAGQVPLFLGQEASLAQFQITRDGGSAATPETRSWQVRFAINFSVIGEVGAHVLLRGKRASVTIWAERDETADALETMLPDLVDAFSAAGLETGSVQCRHGVPRSVPVATGGLVDSVR